MQSLEILVRSVVGAKLGARAIRVEPLAGALGPRKFARVWLESDPEARLPPTLIARVEATEDPQRRPAGIPQEPPLEPIRALLEDRGLPVPRRFAADQNAGIDLHVELRYGKNPHHVVEAIFKGVARALRVALDKDPRVKGVPSVKDSL